MHEMKGPRIIDVVSLGQTEDVKILIEKGKDVNETDDFGNYPVIMAASRNDLETLKLLVEAGARLNVSNKNGDNALVWSMRNQNEEMKGYIEEHTPKNRLKSGK